MVLMQIYVWSSSCGRDCGTTFLQLVHLRMTPGSPSLISKWMWNQKGFTFQAAVKSSSRTQPYQDLAACTLDAFTNGENRGTFCRLRRTHERIILRHSA